MNLDSKSQDMNNLYLKVELDELKTKHVALASKYIKLKDRTRQKLSAAKKVMEGTGLIFAIGEGYEIFLKFFFQTLT